MMNDERMLAALKIALINANLMRACTALNVKNIEYIRRLGSIVYVSTYTDLFNFYKGTAPGAHIKVRPDLIRRGSKTDAWLDYDPKTQGYAPFGLYTGSRKIPMIIDEHGEHFLQEEVLSFPFKLVDLHSAPARKVLVRLGNDHYVDKADLVPRAPAGGGAVYHCELWD